MQRSARIALAAAVATLAMAPGASAASYVPHQVIVKYAPGSSDSARGAVARVAGLVERVASVTGVGARVIRVAGDPRPAAERLTPSPAVLYAEPDQIMKATAV